MGSCGYLGLAPISAEYPKALCFLVPYAPTFKEYSEQQYHELLERNGIQVDAASSAISR